jgi:hypothetical protein
VRAGAPGAPLAHDGRATQLAPEPLEPVELDVDPSLLARGDNLLAVHGLNISPQSSDFTLLPLLRAEDRRDRAADEEALAKLRCAARDAAAARVAYFEARLLQRDGRHREAAAKLAELVCGAPLELAPRLRLIESLRAEGDAAQAEIAARRALDSLPAGAGLERLWELWTELSLADLRLAPAAILECFPARWREGPLEGVRRRSDLRWALEELARDGDIALVLDRAQRAGAAAPPSEGAFRRGPNGGLRVPLPRGRYRVSLGGGGGVEPRWSDEVDIDDGALEIDAADLAGVVEVVISRVREL